MDKQSLVIITFLSLSCCIYAESNRFSSSLEHKNLFCGVDNRFLNGEADEKETNNEPKTEEWHYCNLSSYFLNNSANFGNNAETQATCGYVALAMLLNYYDCYITDYIVEEKYEILGNSSVSPGTLYEANSGLGSNHVADYYDYLRNNYKDSSLHAYLILLDKNALVSNPDNMSSTYMDEFGTNENQLASLAHLYLYMRSLVGLYTVVSNTTFNASYTKEDIISEMVNEIDNGHPVICGFNHHARVLYGYEANSYTFRSHEGYLGNSNVSYPHQIGYDGFPYLNGTDIGYAE